ncbi:MAG: hypothetical protein ACI4VH_02940 [Clostridia bacterium]
MAVNTFVRQQIGYDLVSKDFINVDIGTSSSPNVIKIPVFKNNTQFKFINESQGIYSNDNLYYMDTYSQRWQNAPNVITMFIQDACAIGVNPVFSTNGTTYEHFRFSNSNVTAIINALFDYFSSNTNKVVYNGNNSLGVDNSFNVARSISDISSRYSLTPSIKYIGLGNENSGTLSNFFKRPSDEEMNPTGIQNLAQGNYPYNIENIITSYNVKRWVGEWQLHTMGSINGSPTTQVRAPGFDYINGVYIDAVNIDNENFGSSFSSETNVSIPRFYEPIDYCVIYVDYGVGNISNIYALYRRVYFGVQPFNL